MRPAVVASLGLLAGVTVGVVLGRGPLAPGGEGAALTEVLEAELSHERELGEALRDRVEDLEVRLADAAADAGRPGERAPEPTSGTAAGSAPPGAGAGADDAGPPEPGDGAEGAGPSEPGGGFDEARLMALGYHPSDVERLRRAWEALELERLYVHDERARATQRDGRYWLRMRELEQETLEELGESDFDAMLYAAGARNRVAVTRVLPESPAEDAGFVDGDEIVAYGDRPIYRMHALKTETTRCELGTNVAVTVLRDGTERRIWTPCGPLGIQLEMVNAPPR